MAKNTVRTSAVSRYFEGQTIELDHVLPFHYVPISAIEHEGESHIATIERAIDYLKTEKAGSFVIPESWGEGQVILSVRKNTFDPIFGSISSGPVMVESISEDGTLLRVSSSDPDVAAITVNGVRIAIPFETSVVTATSSVPVLVGANIDLVVIYYSGSGKADTTENVTAVAVASDPYVVSFTVPGYRSPQSTESRPYLHTPWQVGDVVENYRVEEQKCLGWTCVISGVPGLWRQYGTLRPFSNYIESVKDLPDPSLLQIGRQVRYTQGTKEGLFICRWDGLNPVWTQQDYLMGPEAERPATAVNGTWYYNTTIDRYQWYSEKASTWYTIEQVQEMLEKWDAEYQTFITLNQKKVDDKITWADTQIKDFIADGTTQNTALHTELTNKVNTLITESQTSITAEIKKCDDKLAELTTAIDTMIAANNKKVDDKVAEVTETVGTLVSESTASIQGVLDDYSKVVAKMCIIWKESVATFEDIATTYPNPENGWTVAVGDGTSWRYDGISANAWIRVNIGQILDSGVDLKVHVIASRELDPSKPDYGVGDLTIL